MRAYASEALRKRLSSADFPSLWDTQEVQLELQAQAAHLQAALGSELDGHEQEEAELSQERAAESVWQADAIKNRNSWQRRLTVREYLAAEFLRIDGNFTAIAEAQHGRPAKQIDADRHVVEEPVAREGGEETGEGQAQTDGADERAQIGLADIHQNLTIRHRFPAELLDRITRFAMRDRSSKFSKELRAMGFMREGEFPHGASEADAQLSRQRLRNSVYAKFESTVRRCAGQGLASLDAQGLKEVVEKQKAAFDLRDAAKQAADDDADVPPLPAAAPADPGTPAAYFAPGGRWQRPSDCIAHLAAEFEAGNTMPPGKKKKKRKLSQDQVLFLTGFAHACNQAWDEERDEVPMSQRRRFSFLLLGQGGSGKTAIVQEVVLPAIDIIFPPEDPGGSSALIVCSSWAQAQNISTLQHKAVTCHNAAMMRVESLRNANMLPGERKTMLERKLGPKRLLVIEEVSMISPALYNMLLYRFYQGRKDRYAIAEERSYAKLDSAFGRMPLVIHLGDFLQLRPTAGLSLLQDMDALAHDEDGADVPAEFQEAATLFLETPFCYELTGTNRFRNDEGGRELKELTAFMRAPQPETSESYRRAKALWESIMHASDGDAVDARLRETRFQNGHMIAMFWETAAPWMMLRARRDARALHTPLFLLQAADHASPAMSQEMAAKLMNHFNPGETGGMHGMLPVHIGMRVRLTETLCKDTGLVKNAEGVVVRIEVDPQDEERMLEAFADPAANPSVYLTRVPLGIWLKMDKYDESPFVDLMTSAAHMASADVEPLVFLGPTTTLFAFRWREYKVVRSGFAITHGSVRTSTACQGKTFEEGVVIDCARRETGQHPTSNDDWWLHLYVMLSRATSLRDVVLLRAPEASFLLRGPPPALRQRLEMFRQRVDRCHKEAVKMASALGFQQFLQR